MFFWLSNRRIRIFKLKLTEAIKPRLVLAKTIANLLRHLLPLGVARVYVVRLVTALFILDSRPSIPTVLHRSVSRLEIGIGLCICMHTSSLTETFEGLMA